MFEKPRSNPKSSSGSGDPRKKKTSTEDPRRTLGALGEARAASYLARRGYRIDARNVRYDGVEIDLIARLGRMVVFVEVKTRRTGRYGAPELAVDARKQARMVRAARAWLHEHRGSSRSVRFDVIACTVERDRGQERWKIDHWINAFDAGG